MALIAMGACMWSGVPTQAASMRPFYLRSITRQS